MPVNLLFDALFGGDRRERRSDHGQRRTDGLELGD